MSIKRYDLAGDIDGNFMRNNARVEESEDGEFVKYEDYAESQRQFWQLSVTIENLERKVEQLAAKGRELAAEAALVYGKYNETQIPDRDLVDMQTLQEMHELCSGVNIIDNLPDKVLTLAAENAALKSAVTERFNLTEEIKKAGRPPHADFWSQSIFMADKKVRDALNSTQSTDAILAEVRAQGASLVISYHNERADALRDVDRDGAYRHESAALDAIEVLMKIREGAAK